jgi:hypothetical protein
MALTQRVDVQESKRLVTLKELEARNFTYDGWSVCAFLDQDNGRSAHQGAPSTMRRAPKCGLLVRMEAPISSSEMELRSNFNVPLMILQKIHDAILFIIRRKLGYVCV